MFQNIQLQLKKIGPKQVLKQLLLFVTSGGSSVSQNKLPQLILGYIYILK